MGLIEKLAQALAAGDARDRQLFLARPTSFLLARARGWVNRARGDYHRAIRNGDPDLVARMANLLNRCGRILEYLERRAQRSDAR